MKIVYTLFSFFILQTIISQTTVKSKTYGNLDFKELDYGQANVKGRKTEELKNSPTGTRGWLQDFEIIKKTDSIEAVKKANFGVVYIVTAKDTVDINIDIEWIYPEKITNDKGEKFKSIRYTTKRPTNIPSASSYSFDEPYELIKGNWQMNIFIENKRVYSKTFVLY
ncbi:DUF3859 domain-containing protein [Flavobacterium chungangense]|uniref:DUF3859 domain-containing protein n=1 Tax=Flavobacterium chungangense TaxID=554283 RepID=A0A6V6ZE81_9FLAO|nr:DUF3859 domain-containing protein [Flavobacterium chungangense]CAD0009969.1 hypothetical protein FLACHUCJ7_04609 [Flavobacterium chungangense]